MIKDNRQGEASSTAFEASTPSCRPPAYRGPPFAWQVSHDLTQVRPIRACHAEFIIFELRHDIYRNRRAKLALWNI